VQTMAACLGEITSVDFDHEGKYLLAGCKDNSNRLWDLRMVGCVSPGVESMPVLLMFEATESVSVYGASKHVEESHSVRLCARLVNHRRRVRGRYGLPLGTGRGRNHGDRASTYFHPAAEWIGPVWIWVWVWDWDRDWDRSRPRSGGHGWRRRIEIFASVLSPPRSQVHPRQRRERGECPSAQGARGPRIGSGVRR
jgi:hypothetical protein